MGGPLRAEPETDRGEVGLEDRFENDLGRRHHDTVGHRRDTQRPGLARLARLGDMNPSQRMGTIRLGHQLLGEPIEESSHPYDTHLGDRRDCHAVHPGGALVVRHINPCPPQHVAAGDLVVDSVETSAWILLGAAIQHALKGSNLVHLVGFADGSSRSLGTHQGPSASSSCTGEVGVLRSDRVVLSRPSSLLRPPPTSSRPPATSRDHRL